MLIGRLVMSVSIATFAGASPGAAQGLPPGRITDDPTFQETGTIQLGGEGWSRYSWVGSLRCRLPTDAIVGVRTRKGTVVDYIQIACAPVVQGGGAWSWNPQSAYWAAGAGNPNGGGRGRRAVCPQGSAVAGFMGVTTDDSKYLQDVRFECARIARIGPDPLGTGGPAPRPPVVYIDDRTRTWAGWLREGAGIRGQGGFGYNLPAADTDDMNVTGRSKPIHIGRCTGAAASALSAAVGTWFVGGGLGGWTNVVQAFQMFCRQGSESR